jgi:hypothetical protein
MTDEIRHPAPTRVHATRDGRTVIEQPQGSIVLESAAQIVAVINELHACYDYCATWKTPSELTP